MIRELRSGFTTPSCEHNPNPKINLRTKTHFFLAFLSVTFPKLFAIAILIFAVAIFKQEEIAAAKQQILAAISDLHTHSCAFALTSLRYCDILWRCGLRANKTAPSTRQLADVSAKPASLESG